MNNDETTIIQPQNNDKAQQANNVETPQSPKNTGKGVNAAAMAAAAVVGGVMGGGATYVATSALHGHDEEQKPEEEVQAKVDDAATTEHTVEPQEDTPKEEEVAVKVDTPEGEGPDYTGNQGADHVIAEPDGYDNPDSNIHEASNEIGGSEGNDVQVLGIYEAQGEDGQTMQTAVLTNGEDVAAVIDTNGDGEANVIAIDENHNQQIDESEIYDISEEHIQMQTYQETYYAQQQEEMQQEHDMFAHNGYDNQQDYTNDADVQFT